jgi:hypothetical protein
MVANEEISPGRRFSPWRIFGWGSAIGLILLPLIAMQFTSEVNWTLSDFIAAGLMIGLTGGALELAMRTSNNPWARAGAAVMILTCFLLVWVNLAVGFLGSEDNPANIMFLLVLGIAIGGSITTRLRPRAMVRTMLAAAIAQVSIAGIGLAAGWASPGWAGVYEVVMGSTLFGGLWLISAALFRNAAQDEAGTQAE